MRGERVRVVRMALVWGWVLAILALGTVGPGYASATEPEAPIMKNVTLHVLPEYNEPLVMVTVQGEIQGAILPLELRVRLPSGALVSHACGLTQPGDQHQCQPYELQVEGEDQVLSYQLPVSTFFVEYSYSPFSIPGQRNLAFRFQPFYPVQQLALTVLEPLRSTDFTVLPEPASVTTDGQGFRNYAYRYDSLVADQPLELQISYSKADLRPSVNPTQEATSGGGGNKGALLALAMAGALALGLLLYRRLGRRLLQIAAGTVTAPAASRYCTRCGAPMSREFSFCPRCGSLLRPSGGGL